MIRGIHHIAISTPNMEQALGFYRDLLGFEEVGNAEWPQGTDAIDGVLGLKNSSGKAAMLKAGNVCVELFEFTSPKPEPMDPKRPVCNHGHTHLALDVTDIYSVYEKLVAAGIQFHVPPQDFGEVVATYGRDPDGNVFELQQIVNPDDPANLF